MPTALEMTSDWQDTEFRHLYLSAHIKELIALQIRTMREKREWTQGDLGARAGMAQERICAMEDPGYSGTTLKTLKRLAAAFDVALIVRFCPFSELTEWVANLNPDKITPLSFEQESIHSVGSATTAVSNHGLASVSVQVKNADRMMTQASAVEDGIEIVFADGCKGLVPFAEIPEIKDLSELAGMEIPNPYEVILRNQSGEAVELPWDFTRHYCDPFYRPRVEAIDRKGTEVLAARVRALREAQNLTQEQLAAAAGIGRVTLVRIENGEQSPRFETLAALAQALGRPVRELLVSS